MKTTITAEIVNKVRALIAKGVDVGTISNVLSISRASATRILDLVNFAESGDYGAIENYMGVGNRTRLKSIIRDIYGVNPAAQPSQEATTPAAECSDRNGILFAGEVLRLLNRQNELLEKLCDAWGVGVKIERN